MTKWVLGIPLAAVFAFSMIVAPAFAGAHPPWLILDSSTVEAQSSKVTKATIDATGDIPRNTDVLGGYAFPIAGNPNWAFLGITTHDPLRDSHQNPVGWHPHLVNVNASLCIMGVSEGTNGGITIMGDTLMLRIPNTEIGGTISSGTAFGFFIVADAATCPGPLPGLKLVPS